MSKLVKTLAIARAVAGTATIKHAGTKEKCGIDPSALGLWHWAVVTAGPWAEFILPLTILIGLFTCLSALGMIGLLSCSH